MRLPFMDRDEEKFRIQRALAADHGALICLYGRRRVGKSRLVQEILGGRPSVYYVGDARDAALQRTSLAREVARRVLKGFDQVSYPDWESLLSRWWREAPKDAVLAIDEFPALVASAPELPGLLQKHVDGADPGRHLILTGSSQHMMHGLLLDASAPLYGRAREVIRVRPLPISWIKKALDLRLDRAAVESWAVWGGVPRYWELAAEHDGLWAAVTDLLLDPFGVLHQEPARVLSDDLNETARASSILALVGQGSHRLSEIAGRLGLPGTSLSRPLGRLVDLDLVHREHPYGAPARSTRKSLYHIGEPLLRFWYRFVDPNRSRLEAGQVATVLSDVRRGWPGYLGGIWEDLARQSVARISVTGRTWLPASRWWGPGLDRRPMELDIVSACAANPGLILVGEAKLRLRSRDTGAHLKALEQKARRCPPLQGKTLVPSLWVLHLEGRTTRPTVLGPGDVVRAHAASTPTNDLRG